MNCLEEGIPLARKTSKTAHVLNLLAGSTENINPAIEKGKNSFKQEMKNAKVNSNKQDIITQLITECVPEVLDRFNCCECKECATWYINDVARSIESGFAPDALNVKTEAVEGIKNKYRQEVTSRVIKVLIFNKKATHHSAK